MKTRLIISVLTFLTCSVFARYKTFVMLPESAIYPKETNFVVEAGVAVEAVRVNESTDSGVSVATLTCASVVFPDGQLDSKGKSSTEFYLFKGDVIVGPAVIKMSIPTFTLSSVKAQPACVTLRIIHQTGEFVPSNAVLIPADAKGPVNILMESSTNLFDWNQALPGTYGSSSQQRYFRVRAIQQ